MTTSLKWPLMIGLAVLVGIVLVLCSGLTLWGLGQSGGFLRRYETNGERIYFTATSQRGTAITQDLGTGSMGPGMMMGGRLACATCHGSDGRGGRVRMMMASFVAPDIRYGTLTGADEHDGGHEDHPPYTDETIKQAITQGLDPAGNPLAWPMPRWSMSQADLEDLLSYLKTLR